MALLRAAAKLNPATGTPNTVQVASFTGTRTVQRRSSNYLHAAEGIVKYRFHHMSAAGPIIIIETQTRSKGM